MRTQYAQTHMRQRQTHCQTEKGKRRADKTHIPPSPIKLNEMFYSTVLQWSCSTLLYCNEADHTNTMLQSQNASQDPQGDNSKKQRSSKATGACQNVIVTSILTHRGPGTIVGVMEPQTLHVRVAPWCALPHTSSSSYLLPCGPFLIPTAGCIMYSQSQPPLPFVHQWKCFCQFTL